MPSAQLTTGFNRVVVVVVVVVVFDVVFLVFALVIMPVTFSGLCWFSVAKKKKKKTKPRRAIKCVSQAEILIFGGFA